MVSVREIIKKGELFLLDLVYPSRCATCGEWLAADEEGGLCAFCLSQIPKNVPPFCPTCGRNYIGTQNAPRCGACEGKDLPFDRLWFVAPYEGILREALHKLKYEGRRSLGHSLAQPLIAFAKEQLQNMSFDWVLPVPLAKRKERKRQFNQSALLAKAAAQTLSLPLSLGNLLRIRQTLPQVHLPKTKRFENVRDAFWVKDPSPYVGKSLLLIDDIVTTGATISACTKALRTAGVKNVSILTLARG